MNVNFTGLKIANQQTRNILKSYMKRGINSKEEIQTGLNSMDKAAGGVDVFLSSSSEKIKDMGDMYESPELNHFELKSQDGSLITEGQLKADGAQPGDIKKMFLLFTSTLKEYASNSVKDIDRVLDKYM